MVTRMEIDPYCQQYNFDTAAAISPPFTPNESALYGSRPLVTPY